NRHCSGRQTGQRRGETMKAGDLGELALRNLREALLRNSLTTLGVAVGVASLVAMLSLGVGLQELASKRLSQSGLFNTVVVTPRTNLRGLGRPRPANSSPSRASRPLDEGARQEMERLPNVVEVYPQIRFFTEGQAIGAQTGVSDPVNGDSDDGAGSGFSIVPREKKLRIAGIVETEPAAGFGGFGSGRVLIPLEVAAALRAAQVNDLRDVVR